MAIEINEENTFRFPDNSTVLVWYSPRGADPGDRSTWAWLPGSILDQCCPDEWRVVVEAPELAEPDTSVPNDDAREKLLYPVCFRDSSEIRMVTLEQWMRAREGRGR
jgi:hypothetical protein